MKAATDRLAMIPSQPSALLPSLFEHIDEERRLTVLNIGTALPETVEFFSRYRCKLHFVDLFGDLPGLAAMQLLDSEDPSDALQRHFFELIPVPAGTRLDICLFWDLFNFLGRDAIAALMHTLRPHLHDQSLAHGFAVHSLRTAQSGRVYGIRELDQISIRPRPAALPGYSPYNQGQLEKVLGCFRVTRSVLLAESRLELLLGANLRHGSG